jgi:thiamine biosynthesis lipoprotein
MGVEVVVAGADDRSFAEIENHFAHMDFVFSRFRPQSELNAVNAAESWLVPVSPLFAEAVETAVAAAAATDGLVDPTLGAAIAAAGYDRDFGLIEADDRPPGAAVPGSWRTVRVAGRLVFRPPGTTLDLNGVVKSLAVDDALALLPGEGFVAAGGDIATRGSAAVGLPGGDGLQLLAGGLATSGRTSRRWLRGGRPQHHLIDPRSGRPSTSRWLEVTVAADSCLAADIAAKAAFLFSSEGPEWLDERGLPGRFVGPDRTVVNDAWRSALA